jgi:hypothetical protein
MMQKNRHRMYEISEITLTNLLILCCSLLFYFHLDNTGILKWLCPALMLINSMRYFMEDRFENALDFLIRYRWLIGGVIFAVLVILRVSGSSISCYNVLCSSDPAEHSGVIYGTGRMIRTDEYLVQQPYFFSQQANGYREISHMMSISGQNMIIGYNSPVLDFTLIGKPFVWGYMLFGNAVGISWYWCSKTILALLVAFEMCRILTRNDRLSLFGSVLIVYSPVMQWWFAPHMYDVFFWAMALFTVGWHFIMSDHRWKKILTTVLGVSVLVGFVVALFPSLQIACGLLVFALFIACLVRDREQIRFRKIDVIRIMIVIAASGLILGNFVLNARDAIRMLSETAYPGKRVSTGGDSNLSALYTNISNVFGQFADSHEENVCELSTFNHLGVFCILVFPYAWAVQKRTCSKDRSLAVGGVFFFASLIEIEFMLIGFPEKLAKVTLFSYINRMGIAYGFTQALFTIWTFGYLYVNRAKLEKKWLTLIAVLFTMSYVCVCGDQMDANYVNLTPLGKYFYYLCAFGFGVVALLVVWQKKRFAVTLTAAWIVVTSVGVNPVVVGISSVTDHQFVKAAKQCMAEESGAWITVGMNAEQSLLIANGIQTLNAVNYYPDFEKWEPIDPDGKNKKCYNRYEHIIINLTSGPTVFSNAVAADQLDVNLNAADLTKMGVRYLLVHDNGTDAEILNECGVGYQEVYSGSGYKIFRLG